MPSAVPIGLGWRVGCEIVRAAGSHQTELVWTVLLSTHCPRPVIATNTTLYDLPGWDTGG